MENQGLSVFFAKIKNQALPKNSLQKIKTGTICFSSVQHAFIEHLLCAKY